MRRLRRGRPGRRQWMWLHALIWCDVVGYSRQLGHVSYPQILRRRQIKNPNPIQ